MISNQFPFSDRLQNKLSKISSIMFIFSNLFEKWRLEGPT